LLHDIGNPPFGHFGERAIQHWFKGWIEELKDVWKKTVEGEATMKKEATMKTMDNWLCSKWFDSLSDTEKVELKKKAGGGLKSASDVVSSVLKLFFNDFLQFDGNPQGFRIVTMYNSGSQREGGLDLTYSTLMSIIKYSRCTSDEPPINDDGSVYHIYSKGGYFRTEKTFVDKLTEKLKEKKKDFEVSSMRYPLTFIMEAADDIAYTFSDVLDGMENRIISDEEFKKKLSEKLVKRKKELEEEKSDATDPSKKLIEELGERKAELEKSDATDLRNKLIEELGERKAELEKSNNTTDLFLQWAKVARNEAAEQFVKIGTILSSGFKGELLSEVATMKIIKQICRETIYCSPRVESIELSGFAVIEGMLDTFRRLLDLSSFTFLSVVYCGILQGTEKRSFVSFQDGKKVFSAERKLGVKSMEDIMKDFGYEVRLFHKLGNRFVQQYLYAIWHDKNLLESLQGVCGSKDDGQRIIKELWLRAHLIVDHVSGMTDEFALETYQTLKGISISGR